MLYSIAYIYQQPIEEVIKIYADVSRTFDEWLTDSYSRSGPGGKGWSEEKCKSRAKMKTREEYGVLPDEIRWVLRAKIAQMTLGEATPDAGGLE